MKKKIFIIVIILILIALVFLFFHLNKKTNTIKTYGNIEIRQVELSFQVDGIINNLFKEEGDYIKKGELLATIDDRDYIANFNKALHQKNSTFYKSKDDFEKYKRNYPLCKDNTISKEKCDELLNNKDKSKADFEYFKSELEFQKNQLGYTKLFAAQDGIITTRVQEKGARVSKGQIVYILSLNRPIWVRTYIKETDLGKIKYGKIARVITDTKDETGKNKEYKGYVGYISPVAEFSPKTVQTEDLRVDLVYRIRVYIDDIDEFLRQGMPVTVEFEDDKLR
ncbi:MAG: efflux RND transporter periplasmic adaptor subunit [Candidatus Gastranaerophilales bacterium]|nr:efflux RND transporter periplasmic adaptor subunit [Candidatus Gastranaerophilales bacterium]